ncbi:hypothetical protein FDI11_gp06 [Mycobacterium phage Tiger]|uniref:Uncharacterized protein n=1 Tax=Mycobacterium phage Tiger TaxID=1161934 RepID=H9NCZ8_9CAUD|nr:hypothetical protein FDI11_gp06 [Mycobacterium phage Tiger]AFF28469.1 hypothetical protein TIGER_86 [Mycobacterium phage Tiger]
MMWDIAQAGRALRELGFRVGRGCCAGRPASLSVQVGAGA